MAVKSQDDLIAFIEDRAIEKWERSGVPYQLSSIGTEMSVKGDDYKPIIAPLKLRQFVLSTNFPRLKVIAHPYHKAAVALVPKEADFAFADVLGEREGGTQETEDYLRASPPGRYSAAMRLLSILSKLSNDELARIQIPIEILAKLHNLK